MLTVWGKWPRVKAYNVAFIMSVGAAVGDFVSFNLFAGATNMGEGVGLLFVPALLLAGVLLFVSMIAGWVWSWPRRGKPPGE